VEISKEISPLPNMLDDLRTVATVAPVELLGWCLQRGLPTTASPNANYPSAGARFGSSDRVALSV